MIPQTTPLLSIHSHTFGRDCVLRLLEPVNSNHTRLLDRLLAGAYEKPFIVDVGDRRCLHFDFRLVQSEMHIRSPDRLSLAYTRAMMAFLLFNQTPSSILMLGLGGGSLTKFCYRHLPRAILTVIERNGHVIALRNEFHIPRDDGRLRVIQADATYYLEHAAQSSDVILLDVCDRNGTAPAIATIESYHWARRRLTAEGILVVNVCAEQRRIVAHLGAIQTVFGNAVLSLSAEPGGNHIVLAFNGECPPVDLPLYATQTIRLRQRFGFDFSRLIRRISINKRLDRWRRPCRNKIDGMALF